MIIAAPSGAGKSTIARSLLAAEPDLALSVSVTTRPPRPGEREGVDYYFLDRPRFEEMRQAGSLLEWAEVFGRFYGTPLAPVAEQLARGQDVLFDIDWQGWRQIRQALPGDAVGVFVLPPSLNALRERLEIRAGDDAAEIERRMDAARAEISHWREFDHVVVNEVLADCVADVRAILQANRSLVRRQDGIEAFVESLTG